MMAASKNFPDALEDEADARPAHVSVVYDPGNGRVVHVHEFFGTGFKADDCARTALDTVASLGLEKPADLKVLDARDVKFGPDTMLRVDLASLQVVTTTRPRRRGRTK
jgi:hypothetical protein